MFRRVYVNQGAFFYVSCCVTVWCIWLFNIVKESIHSVAVVENPLKIPVLKSLSTDYIVVLISVLYPDGSIRRRCGTTVISFINYNHCMYRLFDIYHTTICTLM
jgi:hypothetical protein